MAEVWVVVRHRCFLRAQSQPCRTRVTGEEVIRRLHGYPQPRFGSWMENVRVNQMFPCESSRVRVISSL